MVTLETVYARMSLVRGSTNKWLHQTRTLCYTSRIHTVSLNTPSDGRLYKPTVASPETHTMGTSLNEYLWIKVHPQILSRPWKSIIVDGLHDRTTANISPIEKTDKPFNWQRPTTAVDQVSRDTIYLRCFPGADYVPHYAAIVATYLALHDKPHDIVQYRIPWAAQCMEPLWRSNVVNMGKVDVVVMGYVHGLAGYTGSRVWEGGDATQLFGWQKMTTSNGTTVAFLGCRVSFWGDIAGNVVRALQRLNDVKCVLYVGKLGSLRAEHTPNTLLATGDHSSVVDKIVNWANVLEP